MTYAELHTKVLQMEVYRNEVAAINFGNLDKDTLRSELITITDNLLSVDFMRTHDFSPYQPDQYISYVEFISEWLWQLRDANAYRLNAEMSYCIEKLIEKWDLQQTQKLVVFTLGDYAVHKVRRNVNTKQIDYLLGLSQVTGVQLTKEPVFVRVPDEFKDHMLANVALFHEVGHFVDRDNYITDMVFTDIYPLLQAKKRSKFKRDYFPKYEGKDVNRISDAKTVVWSHLEEYIADVFGAQYAREQILCYLSYLEAKSTNRVTRDHPSYNSRHILVSAFLHRCEGRRSDSPLLDAILRYLPNLTAVDSPFTEDELLDPGLRFSDIDQLFGSFPLPWKNILYNAKENHLKREGKTDYMQVVALQRYVDLDSNIRRAAHELMVRP